MELDILILTVYFICIGYVVYQMALSVEAELEDQVVLVPDLEGLQTSVRAQLANQGLSPSAAEALAAAPPPLKGGVALSLMVTEPRVGPPPEDDIPLGQIMAQVLPQGPHPLQPVQSLMVQVVNQTQAWQVMVDWDRSSFTRMNNQTLRVIRHTPGMRLDLSLPQVVSVINPNQFLSTQVTSEESLKRNPETQIFQLSAPLVDTEKIASLPPPIRVYSLNLVLQLAPLSGRGARPMVLLVPFKFTVKVLPAQSAIPVLSWFSKR